MKKLSYIILVIILMCTGCSKPVLVQAQQNTKNMLEETAIPMIEQIADGSKTFASTASTVETEAPVTLATSTQTEKPTPTFTVITMNTLESTIEPTSKPTATSRSTQAPIPKATAVPTPVTTAEPTEKPTPEPTPDITPKPIAGEGYMDEMTSASSSYINSVLSAINSKRKANGLNDASLDSSLSVSCSCHAQNMANSGNAYHSSNVVGCEGVSKNHYSMPSGTLGAAMVAHVGQLATADTNKIGIGIVYYGDYMYVCIRGVG